jgi:hypothetical protein
MYAERPYSDTVARGMNREPDAPGDLFFTMFDTSICGAQHAHMLPAPKERGYRCHHEDGPEFGFSLHTTALMIVS